MIFISDGAKPMKQKILLKSLLKISIVLASFGLMLFLSIRYTWFFMIFLMLGIPFAIAYPAFKKFPIFDGKNPITENIDHTQIIQCGKEISMDGAMFGGLLGNALFGFYGAVVGLFTAKQTETTDFLIVYKDGRQITFPVKNDSHLYSVFSKHLS